MTVAAPRHLLAVALMCALSLAFGAASASAAYDASDSAQKAAHDSAFALATRGYEYGLPLLDMQRTFAKSTSVNVSNGKGGGPVNQFNHFTKLADAKDRTVVAPNGDTVYSMAWLDLRAQPLVIHTPKPTKRFHVLEMLSPYTENFANIGSPAKAHPDGDYLITGPAFNGKVPKGLTRIRSPYDRIWIIGRTYNTGPADLPATMKVQHTYRIVPLNRWNAKKPYGYTPPKPKHRDTTLDETHVPGTATGEDAATFFDALGDELKRFPPPAADAPILADLKTLGIGPGLHPTQAGSLSDAQRQGLRDAVTGGPAHLQGLLLGKYFDGFDAHNGWLVGKTGRYGTDYVTRGVVDKYGLGAPTPDVSVYPLTLFDRDKGPLSGKQRYVAHFAAGTFPPPVKFFWSMTMYDNDGFLVDNPKNRYVVNNRTGLKQNADGSMDIYIQGAEPTDPAQRANWLPSPQPTATQTGFRLMVRLYGLTASGIAGVVTGSGWRAPTIRPCRDDGRTADGIACAS